MKLTKTALPFTPIEDYTLEQAIAYEVCKRLYSCYHDMIIEVSNFPGREFLETWEDIVHSCYEEFINDEILYSFTEQIETVNILISENTCEYFMGKKVLCPDEIGKVFKYPEANRYA